MSRSFEATLALSCLAGVLALFLVALAPTWFDRACDRVLAWVQFALVLTAVVLLLVIVAILESFERRRPISDAELDRRITIGMRSARRRGWAPDDTQ